jgi:hypothetical protein
MIARGRTSEINASTSCHRHVIFSDFKRFSGCDTTRSTDTRCSVTHSMRARRHTYARRQSAVSFLGADPTRFARIRLPSARVKTVSFLRHLTPRYIPRFCAIYMRTNRGNIALLHYFPCSFSPRGFRDNRTCVFSVLSGRTHTIKSNTSDGW